MEASDPLSTVEPFLPATISRPGPVSEYGDEVFQNPVSGKYSVYSSNSLPDMTTASSTTTSLAISSLRTPGRKLSISPKEASHSPSTVEPFLPSTCSRPGPVFGIDEEVFRIPPSGKYDTSATVPLSEKLTLPAEHLLKLYQSIRQVFLELH